MKTRIMFAVVALAATLQACGRFANPAPLPTSTATPTPTLAPTNTPSPTVTVTPTMTATQIMTPFPLNLCYKEATSKYILAVADLLKSQYSLIQKSEGDLSSNNMTTVKEDLDASKVIIGLANSLPVTPIFAVYHQYLMDELKAFSEMLVMALKGNTSEALVQIGENNRLDGLRTAEAARIFGICQFPTGTNSG